MSKTIDNMRKNKGLLDSAIKLMVNEFQDEHDVKVTVINIDNIESEFVRVCKTSKCSIRVEVSL